jgi:hypothetical protein
MRKRLAIACVVTLAAVVHARSDGIAAIMENNRPPVLSETNPIEDSIVLAQRQQFDPPACVSGAETYCQPLPVQEPPRRAGR